MYPFPVARNRPKPWRDIFNRKQMDCHSFSSFFEKKTFSLNFRSISFPLDANVIFRVQTVKHYSRFITAAKAEAMSDVYCRAVFQFSLGEKIMQEDRKRIEYQWRENYSIVIRRVALVKSSGFLFCLFWEKLNLPVKNMFLLLDLEVDLLQNVFLYGSVNSIFYKRTKIKRLR